MKDFKKGQKLSAKDLNEIVKQVKRANKIGVSGLGHSNSLTGTQIYGLGDTQKEVALISFTATSTFSAYPSITDCMPEIYPAVKLQGSFEQEPVSITDCTDIQWSPSSIEIIVGNLANTYIPTGTKKIAYKVNGQWWVEGDGHYAKIAIAQASGDHDCNDSTISVISVSVIQDQDASFSTTPSVIDNPLSIPVNDGADLLMFRDFRTADAWIGIPPYPFREVSVITDISVDGLDMIATVCPIYTLDNCPPSVCSDIIWHTGTECSSASLWALDAGQLMPDPDEEDNSLIVSAMNQIKKARIPPTISVDPPDYIDPDSFSMSPPPGA